MQTAQEQWQKIKALFQELADQNQALREAALANVDPSVAVEVRRLLKADEQKGEHVLPSNWWCMTAPEEIGPFTLVRELGWGGMGVVYLARRKTDFEQEVAIKLLDWREPEIVQAFRRERVILAQLEHPCIARLLDGGEIPDGRLYLVMEMVRGKDLAEWAKGRSKREVARCMLDICRALEYAHGKLIVHCDLKPSNILVDSNGRPKLLDFGLAAVMHHRPEGNHRFYTPKYAGAELREGLDLTAATDLYSVGVILLELIAEDLDLQAIGLQGKKGGYSSASAMADDLERYLAFRPTRARPRSWIARASLAIRRNPAFAVLGFALAMAMMAALGLGWQARQRSNELRALSTKVLLNAQSRISSLPGTLTVQKLLLSESIKTLESLTGNRNHDEDLAEAYLRIGNWFGNPDEPNVGEYEKAVAAWQKARALSRDPARLEQIQRREAALDLYHGGITKALQGSAETHGGLLDLGVAEYRQGNYGKAWQCFLRARTLAENSLQRGVAALRLNETLMAQGRPAEALELLEQALQELPDDPLNVPIRRQRQVLLRHCGDRLRELSKPEKAKEKYLEALRLARQLRDQDTGNAQAKRDLFLCNLRLGDLELAQDRNAEAYFQAAKLLAEQPLDRALADARLSHQSYKNGKFYEAYLQAKQGLRKIYAQPNRSVAIQVYEISLLARAGDSAAALGRVEEAIQLFSLNHKILDSIAAAGKATPTNRKDRALAASMLGHLEGQRGRKSAAAKWLKQAIDELQALPMDDDVSRHIEIAKGRLRLIEADSR